MQQPGRVCRRDHEEEKEGDKERGAPARAHSIGTDKNRFEQKWARAGRRLLGAPPRPEGADGEPFMGSVPQEASGTALGKAREPVEIVAVAARQRVAREEPIERAADAPGHFVLVRKTNDGLGAGAIFHRLEFPAFLAAHAVGVFKLPLEETAADRMR